MAAEKEGRTVQAAYDPGLPALELPSQSQIDEVEQTAFRAWIKDVGHQRDQHHRCSHLDLTGLEGAQSADILSFHGNVRKQR